MIVGVPKEIYPKERRVAIVPTVIPNLKKSGLEVVVEAGAGIAAGYPDAEYADKGAQLVTNRAELFQKADIVVQFLCYGANDKTGSADLPLMRKGQALIGFVRPLGTVNTLQEIAERGVSAFSVELMPRTTRAQSMDALSSMATICGYKAVVLAANTLPRMFPMLTTAAGTIAPARVLIIGAGVAGLQAIATARRLGAVASAYDMRPAAKEQVQSLGGRFVELPIEAKDAQDARGYGKAQDEAFYQKQRELLGKTVAESDVVITAAVMDDINGDFPQTDVALIIGANDVTNPAAREDKSSPIYGMPILDVDKAHTVMVIKRSMAAGFAGIENPLYYLDKTLMLFGDARTFVGSIVRELSGGHG
jgi:H+-translocating NAD(P) transhydrogenase subunit alpha